MVKYITLYEGECERSIIEWLKVKGYIFGRMYKQVLSDIKNINRSLNMINKKTVVTVVMDCDTIFLRESNVARLNQNIKWLLQNSKKLRIITQNKNLEDELVKGLGLKNLSILYQHFNSSNKTTYKQKLANLIPEKLEIKLADLDLNIFWATKILHQFYQQKDILILNCALSDIKRYTKQIKK